MFCAWVAFWNPLGGQDMFVAKINNGRPNLNVFKFYKYIYLFYCLKMKHLTNTAQKLSNNWSDVCMYMCVCCK